MAKRAVDFVDTFAKLRGPVYFVPALAKTLSPQLKERVQGKPCFNFTTVDPAQIEELTALTRNGIARFEKLKLPWP